MAGHLRRTCTSRTQPAKRGRGPWPRRMDCSSSITQRRANRWASRSQHRRPFHLIASTGSSRSLASRPSRSRTTGLLGQPTGYVDGQVLPPRGEADRRPFALTAGCVAVAVQPEPDNVRTPHDRLDAGDLAHQRAHRLCVRPALRIVDRREKIFHARIGRCRLRLRHDAERSGPDPPIPLRRVAANRRVLLAGPWNDGRLLLRRWLTRPDLARTSSLTVP